jgi:hypothetical protein
LKLFLPLWAAGVANRVCPILLQLQLTAAGRKFFAQKVSTAISRGCSRCRRERRKSPREKRAAEAATWNWQRVRSIDHVDRLMFKEHRMMLEFTTQGPRPKHLAFVLLGAASLFGCSQDAASTPTTASDDDATSAYQALSTSLQTCQDAATSCETAAGSDATKLAACKSDAESCRDKTKPQEAEAHKRLHGAADGCFKGAHHEDEDGGVDDGKGRHDCLRQHVPPVPLCLEKLFVCLIDNGFGRRQADVNAFSDCVDTAHTCIVDAIDERMMHHGGGAGGASAAAGSPAPVAGSPAPVAGSHEPFAGSHEPIAGAGGHDGKKGLPWDDGQGSQNSGPGHDDGHSHDHAGAGGHP